MAVSQYWDNKLKQQKQNYACLDCWQEVNIKYRLNPEDFSDPSCYGMPRLHVAEDQVTPGSGIFFCILHVSVKCL